MVGKQFKLNVARLEKVSMAIVILCSASLFGLSAVKSEDLDVWLNIALGCFAIGLPPSSLILMINLEREHFGKSLSGITNIDDAVVCISLGMVIGILGIIPLFFHFSFIHGTLFLITMLLSTNLYFRLSEGVNEELSKESEPSQQNNSDAEINR